MEPAEIKFARLTIKLVSVFRFTEGSSVVEITRRIVESSEPAANLECNEYITACYGTTEYPEDMTGIILSLESKEEKRSLSYEYRCREDELADARASALVPAVQTIVSVYAKDAVTAYFKEGYAFSPIFTLGLKKEICMGEEVTTWLKLEKAN